MEHSKKELIKEIACLSKIIRKPMCRENEESFSKIQKKQEISISGKLDQNCQPFFLLMASVLPFAFNKLFRQGKTDVVAVLKPVVKDGANSPAVDSDRKAVTGSDTAAMRLAHVAGRPSGALKSATVNPAADLTAKQGSIAL